MQWPREKEHGQTIIQNTAHKTKDREMLINWLFSEVRVPLFLVYVL
jgi:hypothetical protein